MRARRHRGGESGEEHGIDLAPMLDFVLNLLIFFIITTSFVREPGIFVNAAEAETALGARPRERPRGGGVLDRVRRERQRLRPRDQRLSQPHFELAQPVTDRACGDAQFVGGGHDAAEARDRFERLQAVQGRKALHALGPGP